MAESKIEWTEVTWNPVTGCDRISAGCDNCYALTLAARLKAMGQAHYQADGNPITSGPGFAVTIHPDALDLPLRWRRPRTVFVNSMSDLFHARVPREFVEQVWQTMERTPQHTYQILTKRPERMARIVAWLYRGGFAFTTADPDIVPGNVWLGTSVEDARVTHRIDALRAALAAVRFLSLEPLIGPLYDLDLTNIGWVIVGGESGHGARPCNPAWIANIVRQCQAAGVPVFVKQLGAITARRYGLDPKGGDMDRWPADLADLRVREFPTAREAVAS